MFETLKEALPALQSEASTYSDGVRIWIRVMALSFFSGIIFAVVSRRSLYIVAMALLTLIGLVIGQIYFPEISRSTFGAIIHLILWPLAFLGLWRPGELIPPGGLLTRIYPIWKYWVSALILVSLIFDIKSLL